MKNRTKTRLTYLLGILLIFILIILFKDRLSFLMSSKQQSIFPNLKTDNITEISINSGSKKTVLLKKNNQWTATVDKEIYQADQDKVNTLLNSLKNLTKKDVVSTNKNNHKNLGVDKNLVSFKQGNSVNTLYIGYPSGEETFVRKDQDTEVFSTNVINSNVIYDDYRNLEIPLVNELDNVNKVMLIYEEKNINLEKKANEWLINGQLAKKEQVDYFLSDLKTLRANDVSHDQQIRNGLSLPDITISLTEKNNQRELNAYYLDENSYYITVNTNTDLYIITKSVMDALKKSDKYFLGTEAGI